MARHLSDRQRVPFHSIGVIVTVAKIRQSYSAKACIRRGGKLPLTCSHVEGHTSARRAFSAALVLLSSRVLNERRKGYKRYG